MTQEQDQPVSHPADKAIGENETSIETKVVERITEREHRQSIGHLLHVFEAEPPARLSIDTNVTPPQSARIDQHHPVTFFPLAPNNDPSPQSSYTPFSASSSINPMTPSGTKGLPQFPNTFSRSPVLMVQNLSKGNDTYPVDICCVSQIDGGFFVNDSVWTCYRRNYFHISSSLMMASEAFASGKFEFTSYNLLENQNVAIFLPSANGSMSMIKCFNIGLRVSSNQGFENKPPELVAHSSGKDKLGPQNALIAPRLVDPTTALTFGPGSELAHEYQSPQSDSGKNRNLNRANFQRIQFRSATSNNGKRRSIQQYFTLHVTLYAETIDGAIVEVGDWGSEEIAVRGRSPGHYAEMESRGPKASRISALSHYDAYSPQSPSRLHNRGSRNQTLISPMSAMQHFQMQHQQQQQQQQQHYEINPTEYIMQQYQVINSGLSMQSPEFDPYQAYKLPSPLFQYSLEDQSQQQHQQVLQMPPQMPPLAIIDGSQVQQQSQMDSNNKLQQEYYEAQQSYLESKDQEGQTNPTGMIENLFPNNKWLSSVNDI